MIPSLRLVFSLFTVFFSNFALSASSLPSVLFSSIKSISYSATLEIKSSNDPEMPTGSKIENTFAWDANGKTAYRIIMTGTPEIHDYALKFDGAQTAHYFFGAHQSKGLVEIYPGPHLVWALSSRGNTLLLPYEFLFETKGGYDLSFSSILNSENSANRIKQFLAALVATKESSDGKKIICITGDVDGQDAITYNVTVDETGFPVSYIKNSTVRGDLVVVKVNAIEDYPVSNEYFIRMPKRVQFSAFKDKVLIGKALLTINDLKINTPVDPIVFEIDTTGVKETARYNF